MGRIRKRRGYVVNGRRVMLRVDPEFELVRISAEAAELALDIVDFEAAAATATSSPHRYRIPGEDFAIVRTVLAENEAFVGVPELAPPAELSEGASPALHRRVHGPVFFLGRHHRAVATNRVLVEAVEGEVEPVIRPVLDRRLGLGGYQIETRGDARTAVVRVGSGADLFTLSARLRRQPGVAYAQPDFITLYNPVLPLSATAKNKATLTVLAYVGDAGNGVDPLEGLQRALQLIGAQGLQQRGHESAVIAVLDAPVDLEHPDLQPALKPLVDVLPAGTEVVPDPHATACAGLIAAVAGNGIGGRGLAAGCKLLPVRFARASPGNPLFQAIGSGEDAARAVDAAREAGAWVISLSWVFLENPKLQTAIERAREQGRGGKGCVVVAGAGNDGEDTYFPARLPGVVGVGASDHDNRPKTLASSLGGSWITCKGSISVAAPGVANLTTDVTGPAGYNRSNGSAGDFVHDFCGTSAAAPLVAAAAALVLCANPCLRENQVRDILCRTAAKPKGVTFKPEGPQGRNARMGFGILDVGAAVREAVRMLENGEVSCPEKLQ